MFELYASICDDAQICHEVLLPSEGFTDVESCEAWLPPDTIIATLPAQAALGCATRRPPNLDFVEVGDGVYVHYGAIAPNPDDDNRGDLSNIAFVVGDDSVSVIDSGGAYWIGGETYLAIREITDLPIGWQFLTHVHPDHVYGAAFFQDLGVETVGHANLPEALALRAESYSENYLGHLGLWGALSRLPRVDRAIDQESNFGDLRAMPMQTAHTNSDMIMRDQKTGMVFAGDLLFHQHIPALDGSLRGWQAVIEELHDIDPQLLVSGHGDDPNIGFHAEERYLDSLAEGALDAIDQGMRTIDAQASVAAEEADQWQLFEDFNPRNVVTAISELEWE